MLRTRTESTVIVVLYFREAKLLHERFGIVFNVIDKFLLRENGHENETAFSGFKKYATCKVINEIKVFSMLACENVSS